MRSRAQLDLRIVGIKNSNPKRMDTKAGKWWGVGDGGVMNWETGTDIHTLIRIK